MRHENSHSKPKSGEYLRPSPIPSGMSWKSRTGAVSWPIGHKNTRLRWESGVINPCLCFLQCPEPRARGGFRIVFSSCQGRLLCLAIAMVDSVEHPLVRRYPGHELIPSYIQSIKNRSPLILARLVGFHRPGSRFQIALISPLAFAPRKPFPCRQIRPSILDVAGSGAGSCSAAVRYYRPTRAAFYGEGEPRSGGTRRVPRPKAAFITGLWTCPR